MSTTAGQGDGGKRNRDTEAQEPEQKRVREMSFEEIFKEKFKNLAAANPAPQSILVCWDAISQCAQETGCCPPDSPWGKILKTVAGVLKNEDHRTTTVAKMLDEMTNDEALCEALAEHEEDDISIPGLLVEWEALIRDLVEDGSEDDDDASDDEGKLTPFQEQLRDQIYNSLNDPYEATLVTHWQRVKDAVQRSNSGDEESKYRRVLEDVWVVLMKEHTTTLQNKGKIEEFSLLDLVSKIQNILDRKHKNYTTIMDVLDEWNPAIRAALFKFSEDFSAIFSPW